MFSVLSSACCHWKSVASSSSPLSGCWNCFPDFLQFHWNSSNIKTDAKLKLMWSSKIDVKSKTSPCLNFGFASISVKAKSKRNFLDIDSLAFFDDHVDFSEIENTSFSDLIWNWCENVKVLWNRLETEAGQYLIWNGCETVELMWDRSSISFQFYLKLFH